MCCFAFLASYGSVNLPSLVLTHMIYPVKDISINSRDNPHLLQVTIKQSKTDSFRRGIHLYMGVTDGRICPVKAILSYLAMRSGQARPLFVTKEGKGLTRQMFSSALNSLLQLDCKHYNTHSPDWGSYLSHTSQDP